MKAHTTLRTSPRDDIAVPRAVGCRAPVRSVLGFLVATLALTAAVPLIATPAAAQADPFALRRSDMVENQVRRRGIEEPSLLTAMKRVPRHLFVPESLQPQAYDESPVTIAPDQRLPQAFLSARMIELLELDGDEKVLEIGTGSGYDAAVLSRLAREVYTIEIDETLGRRAKRTLAALGYDNVEVRIGDGLGGWPEKAPFDAILVTAAPEAVPPRLLEQLKVGGKMVVAVGGAIVQDLQVITMTRDGAAKRRISPVLMEPMIEPQSD